ncbi:Exocyst complex component S5 [Malassezia brasiliensis]|uniref:Exocyst complex component SEC5 n=1 Tax=Malassezia brasiliensis TaxID=1821822 RepID=A0AAF0DY80_9BASI|nr:Exocyst complex component S5 [Malassezia brasiliensis]
MAIRVEEAELLQAYQLPTLNPRQWQTTGDASHGGDGGGEEWHDPLGLRTTLPVGRVEPSQRPQISIGSKAFDAKAFLNTVHPNASFADLSRGAQQLKTSISQRSEALKVLVDENFDRFVSVKATTDGVFREMALPGGPLAPGADLGVARLREPLQQANARADHVFRPVLENYVKVMKLRNTLGVFQRSHFFFNLPGSLNENIRAGHYEVALRDYKKGKYLLESRPGQLLPVQDSGAAGAPSEAQLVQQRRIFAKVWDAVEDAMYDMQKRLLAHLREPQHSVEEQEKCIEVLLELDPATDPVAVFLKSQHEHIQSRLRAAFEREQGAIDAARLNTDHTGRSTAEQARDLSQCLTLVRTAYGTKPSFSRALHAPVWEAIDHMVATLCSTVVQSVPTFWRIARDYAEGRLAKVAPRTDTAVHQQAQQWAADSMAQFTTRLYAFFGLAPFAARAQEPLFATLPTWVPDPSCSLSTTHYLSSILGSLTDTLAEFKTLAIPGVTQRLEALVLDVRFQFTEVLCCLWLRDARLCHHLETWSPNSQQPAITSYLFSLSVFNRWNAREGFYIADGRARMQGTPTAHDNQVLAAFSARLKTTFVQALYAFLEGIVAAALSPDAGAAWEARALDAAAPSTAPDRDTRILLSVSNLSHLRTHIIGAWVKQFEEAYHVSLADEQQQLVNVCAKLDKELLHDFVQRKGDAVSAVLHRGILEGGIDWAHHEKPTCVHAFVYQALLLLVEVHAQIRATVPPLVSRVISALVEIMADAALSAYGRVPVYNKGGMLQATLEIEFVHQTMSFHVSPSAEQSLKRVYETISQRYTSTSGGEQDALHPAELEAVKQTLIASRKATALEFLCFRRPKTDEGRSSKSRK